MLEIYIKLLPVFAFFALGVILSQFKYASHEHGGFLLKLMFFVTLPILILVKLPPIEIGPDKIYLPLMNILINLGCMMVMIITTRFMQIERKTLGVMLVSSMIINNIFIFPFILTVLGDEAFADAIIFDIGNGLTTLTLTYVVAFSYGPNRARLRAILLNMIKLPVMWALLLALLLNFNSITLPESINYFLEPIGLLTSPLILIALGIYFTPRMKNLSLISLTIFIRMFFGLLIGISLATIFNLQGQTYAVVVLCSAAPIGFNALTYSSLAKLDMEFASSAVSMSILIGMITIPIMMSFML